MHAPEAPHSSVIVMESRRNRATAFLGLFIFQMNIKYTGTCLRARRIAVYRQGVRAGLRRKPPTKGLATPAAMRMPLPSKLRWAA